MQVALNMLHLREAVPENVRGTFGDSEIDAAWDEAVGLDKLMFNWPQQKIT